MARGRGNMCVFWWVVLIAPVLADRPNVVVIVADDLGWNDVGFHGLNDIPTPNLDALAYSGVTLHNYYVTPICTPSRAAFMTGKYPIHTGMQHGVLYGTSRGGLPLKEKLLPQYLKKLGYGTHLVGKWHLGMYEKEYLPLNRGFDSHVGFWTGRIDMYEHTSMEHGSWGFDFRRGYDVAHDLYGKYVTDVITDEAVKVIVNHNTSSPLFLMIGHSAVHSGNPHEPIRAPDTLIAKFKHIKDYQRQKFAAVLTKLDESVGAVVSALKQRHLLENSIILFTTDNGGPAGGFNDNAASNWPLRGVKNTLWEGGTRAVGFLWGSHLHGKRVAQQKIHIVDWLPTLLSAVGGNLSLPNIDGLDLWPSFTQDAPSPRKDIVYNIDDVWGSTAISKGDWKLVVGTNYNGQWDSWYGPDGRNATYDMNAVLNSVAAKSVADVTDLPTPDEIDAIRKATAIKCSDSILPIECKPLKSPCVFNIKEDPCERRNLAMENPAMLNTLLAFLNAVNRTAVPPISAPLDKNGDPKLWGRVYTNFGDFRGASYISDAVREL